MASFLFFMIKVLYSEISVSEMESGCISLSVFLAVQHPSILHALHALSDSAVPQNRALFPLGDCHSRISWTPFSRSNILWCKISLRNLFYDVPFIPLQIICHLYWCFCPSDVCWLLPCPSHVTLLGCTPPVHLFLPHKSKVVNLILARAKSEEGLIITEIKVKYRV